jgi:SAM-dependent methyltransferase
MSNTEKIREIVREAYGSIARRGQDSGCCCGPSSSRGTQQVAEAIGYSKEELAGVPSDSNLGLGCGNPTALASLKPGETVLDLGSGAGFDCFLAAERGGPSGRVIGVDMTPEMIDKAQQNAVKSEVDNVDFRLGQIERLPVEDASIDVVISNCVINLSPDKTAVFREIARVLKPGGRVAVSDIVLLDELPEELRDNIEAYTGCISGAIEIDDYRASLEAAGLKSVKVTTKDVSGLAAQIETDPLAKAAACCLGDEWLEKPPIASAYIEAQK